MNNTTAWQNDDLMRQLDDQTEDFQFRAEKTDRQLIELVLAGEENVFEEIVDRHKLLVATVTSRYFRRPEQIEEVTQICFTKIYFELKNFQFKHELAFAGWIARIATNACLDILRSRKRRPEDLICELSTDETEFLISDAPHEAQNPENQLVERDLAAKLMACLDPEDQAIMQMLYEEEMSVGEISEATGWSKSKIKIRAFRARKILRKFIGRFL